MARSSGCNSGKLPRRSNAEHACVVACDIFDPKALAARVELIEHGRWLHRRLDGGR